MRWLILLSVIFLCGCHSVTLNEVDDKIILKVGRISWGDLDSSLISKGLVTQGQLYEVVELRKVVRTVRSKK